MQNWRPTSPEGLKWVEGPNGAQNHQPPGETQVQAGAKQCLSSASLLTSLVSPRLILACAYVSKCFSPVGTGEV